MYSSFVPFSKWRLWGISGGTGQRGGVERRREVESSLP